MQRQLTAMTLRMSYSPELRPADSATVIRMDQKRLRKDAASNAINIMTGARPAEQEAASAFLKSAEQRNFNPYSDSQP
jgi:hypothetical protein